MVMAPNKSPHANDNEANDLNNQSKKDLFRYRRPSKQHKLQENVASGFPSTSFRSVHSRSVRRRLFTIRRLFIAVGFALLLLCVVSLFLQSRMASDFLEKNEKAWSHKVELRNESTLKFMPPRAIEGDEFDRVRAEARRGARKPRLALVLGNMEKDPESLMLITVMKHIKELGYVFEIFAGYNGKARRMWEQLGPLFLLSSEPYGYIDWSLYEGIIVDSLQTKDFISSTMLEPFCSVPLIWIIQDDILAKYHKMYDDLGWKNLIYHWKTTFSRASAVVFPNFALPMIYTALDPGNFHVIHGSPVDVWVAEVYRKSHFKNQLREDYGFGREDFMILVVGSSFFYDEFSMENAMALHSIEPLLIKYARKENAGKLFKFVFLCGDITGENNDTQEATSRLGLLHDSLRQYGFDKEVNDILLMADIVLYGSSHIVQDFSSLLIRAMTFGIPIVAPDLPIIKEYVVEKFHGILLTKYDSDALVRTFSILISDGKLSRFAHKVASTGRLLAKNMFASECIAGYASLFEKVLDFPSDVMLPGSITQLPKGVWEWDLFRKEIVERTFVEQDLDERRKSSVLSPLENELVNHALSSNISCPGNEILVHDTPTQQDWDIIEEIEDTEKYIQEEMEELHHRIDSKLGAWEEVYRTARKSDRIKLIKEKDEEELERIGRPVCIYEIYSGPATWPFLHHGPLYRGLSLSRRTLRSQTDDINAVRRLPLLNETFYQDILCEIGGMFAIANKIDTIHRRPWIGFQSWKAEGRKVSLSAIAEKALEDAIQENTRGEVIYFWAYLDVDRRVMNSNGAFPFWSFCDVINGGRCRTTFEDAFRHMYGIPSDAEALPPMPDDGGRWSALHSWVMPTPTFVEFIMFSRMFADSVEAVHSNFTENNRCFLASSKLEKRHCYCRLLEILVNVWAYHSGRRMIYLDPRSGVLEEQHPVEARQELMWSKYFRMPLLKAMDEDLAEAADEEDHPRKPWLWPSTGEVFWPGIYQREREERYRQKMANDRKMRAEKLNRLKKQKHGHKHRSRGHKQSPIGEHRQTPLGG